MIKICRKVLVKNAIALDVDLQSGMVKLQVVVKKDKLHVSGGGAYV